MHSSSVLFIRHKFLVKTALAGYLRHRPPSIVQAVLEIAARPAAPPFRRLTPPHFSNAPPKTAPLAKGFRTRRDWLLFARPGRPAVHPFPTLTCSPARPMRVWESLTSARWCSVQPPRQKPNPNQTRQNSTWTLQVCSRLPTFRLR